MDPFFSFVLMAKQLSGIFAVGSYLDPRLMMSTGSPQNAGLMTVKHVRYPNKLQS